jgi:hypothetical protein
VKHWYNSKELTLDDFPAGNYTLEHVPTSYYEAGKIDKVLSDVSYLLFVHWRKSDCMLNAVVYWVPALPC